MMHLLIFLVKLISSDGKDNAVGMKNTLSLLSGNNVVKMGQSD